MKLAPWGMHLYTLSYLNIQNDSTDWTVYIDIAGLIIGLVGVGFGVYGISKQKNAEAAVARARNYVKALAASKELLRLSVVVSGLHSLVETERWQETRASATTLRQELSKAVAFGEGIIDVSGKDNLNGALAEIRTVFELLPLGNDELDNDIKIEIFLRIDSAAAMISYVSGTFESIQYDE